MKKFDLLGISLKNLKGRWAVLPALGIAISTFCLCFAGAALTTVQKEKGQPYVLQVSAKGTIKLTDNTVAKISELPDVIAATPLLQVPVTVKTGAYSANMTLTGVNPSFIKDKFAEGAVFPDSSGMPYIILNKAACKLFSDGKTATTNIFDASGSSKSGTENAAVPKNDATDVKADSAGNANSDTGSGAEEEDDKLPNIDWLKAGFSLQSGSDSRWIASKVSGLLEGDDSRKEPAAYISLSAAKELLHGNRQSTDYVGLNVRIRNIGCTGSVSDAIGNLGLTVTNSNIDLQGKWDGESKEMAYLTVIGAFSLLCSAVLIAAWKKITLLEQKETWELFRLMGMKEKDIGRLFVIQVMMISLIGILIGIIVSISLPSFLQTNAKETSIYQLQIPLLTAVISAAIGVFVPILQLLTIKNGNA